MNSIYPWTGRDNLLFITFHSLRDTIKRQQILRARRVNPAAAAAADAHSPPFRRHDTTAAIRHIVRDFGQNPN